MHPFQRTYWSVAVVLLLTAGSSLAAPVLPTYTKADVIGWGRDGFNSAFYDTYTIESATDIIIPTMSGSDTSGFATEAEAAVYIGSKQLKSRAWASGPAPGPSNDKFATTTATVAWRDALLPTGGGPSPDSLTFHFSVDGQITIADVSFTDQYPQYVSRAYMVIRPNVDSFAFPGLPPLPSSPADYRFLVESVGAWTPYDAGGNEVQVTDGWDTASYTTDDGLTYQFTGTFSLTSSLFTGFGLPDGGAYPISVQMTSGASSRGGPSAVDFFHTLTLTGITDPSGAPIDPADWRFDSGAPVPGPAGLALLFAAMPMITRRRRGGI